MLGGVFLLSAVFSLAVAPTGTRYPFALQVETTLNAGAAVYNHEGGGYVLSPPAAGSTSFVGRQARDAYLSFASQLFQPDAKAQLTLLLVAVVPSVELKDDGWHAVVRHELELRGSGKSADLLLGNWTVIGRGRINGIGESAVPTGFTEATAVAERQFEAQFEDPAGVADLLQRFGIAKGSVVRRQAIREAPPPPPPKPADIHPQSTGLAFYVEGGVRVSNLSYPAPNSESLAGSVSSELIAPGFDLRLGVAYGYGFAQFVFARTDGSGDNIEHTLTSVGGDAGVKLRLTRLLELAGGIGLYATNVDVASGNFGPQPVSQSNWQFEPDLMAQLRLTPIGNEKIRMRLTFEARYRLVSFDTSLANNSFSDSLDSGFSLAMLLGVEFSVGWRPSR